MVCGWLELRGVSRLELGRIGREVVFDHERVVVNAGIVLAVALGRRLGIEARVDGAVRLGRGRAPAAGRQGALAGPRVAARGELNR
jgi:hypothetical protein